MIALNASTYFYISLDGAIVTADIPFSISYIGGDIEKTDKGAVVDTTRVKMNTLPGRNYIIQLTYLKVINVDTVPHVVTIESYDGDLAVYYVEFRVSLAAGDALIFNDGGGWSVLTSIGAIKTSNTAAVGAIALTNTHILVGDATNMAADVAMSGDATMANTGALTIANNAVTYAKFQQVASARLLGNPGGGVANVSEISLGAGLSFAGATLVAAGTGANTALSNLASVAINTALILGTSDAAALGSATKMWSDLFLASGAVINFNNGNVTLTHAAGLLTLAGGGLKLAAGTATLAPLNFPSGTIQTAPAAGDMEFDGEQLYGTIDIASSRGAIPVEQYFHLTVAGGVITTIANFFGANGNITLVANAYYIIDIYVWFLNTTGGTVVWTFTNSAAPMSQNLLYESSPSGGIPAPPGSAASLTGHIYNDATAALALAPTATLATGVNHYMHTRIYLQNGTGTSLQIQATKSVGSITPGINSYWFCRRISPNNIGTPAA